MIEVFKTNITKPKRARQVVEKLLQKFPHYKVNFDLEDCDNILRIENPEASMDATVVKQFVQDMGFSVKPLPDN